jgi:hypothetical protein
MLSFPGFRLRAASPSPRAKFLRPSGTLEGFNRASSWPLGTNSPEGVLLKAPRWRLECRWRCFRNSNLKSLCVVGAKPRSECAGSAALWQCDGGSRSGRSTRIGQRASGSVEFATDDLEAPPNPDLCPHHFDEQSREAFWSARRKSRAFAGSSDLGNAGGALRDWRTLGRPAQSGALARRTPRR